MNDATQVPGNTPGIGSGFEWAGRITTGYDGGNHPLKGDVIKCRSCGNLLLPEDQGTHERLHTLLDEALAALAAAPSLTLKLHLISAHCNAAGLELDDAEAAASHRHEHTGPGTIRNHSRNDLSWDAAKVCEVLAETAEMEVSDDSGNG